MLMHFSETAGGHRREAIHMCSSPLLTISVAPQVYKGKGDGRRVTHEKRSLTVMLIVCCCRRRCHYLTCRWKWVVSTIAIGWMVPGCFEVFDCIWWSKRLFVLWLFEEGPYQNPHASAYSTAVYTNLLRAQHCPGLKQTNKQIKKNGVCLCVGICQCFLFAACVRMRERYGTLSTDHWPLCPIFCLFSQRQQTGYITRPGFVWYHGSCHDVNNVQN